jgi:hypothetical protein
MLLGQSVFQSVLTRLKEERKDDDETETTEAAFRIRGLGAGFVAPTVEQSVATDANVEAYFAYLPDEAELMSSQAEEGPAADAPFTAPAPETSVPIHLLRLTEAEIAEELAISAQDTETVLNEKRRTFAKANHPDRVAPEFRDSATIRMTTANLLIDRAIGNLSRR